MTARMPLAMLALAGLALTTLLPRSVTAQIHAPGLSHEAPDPATPDARPSHAPSWTFLSALPILELPARSRHSIVVDSRRGKLVIFGGVNDAGVLGELWERKLLVWGWTRVDAGPGPVARTDHSAIYDPSRRRMVVFGGRDARGELLDDVWAITFDADPAWERVHVHAGPSKRAGHGAVYDPVGDRMVVFGGDDGAPRNDAWSLSFAGGPAWTPLPPGGAPPARSEHAAVYDLTRRRMVVFGGWDGGAALDDLWALDLASDAWTSIAPAGPRPPARRSPAIAYHINESGLVNWDGTDVWSLSLANPQAWVRLNDVTTGPRPTPRSSPRSVFATHQGLLVMGGHDGAHLNDVWLYRSLSAYGYGDWVRLRSLLAEAPEARTQAAPVYDSRRGRLLVLGGQDPHGSLPEDVWAYPLSGAPAWHELDPDGYRPKGSGSGMIYEHARDRIVAFGPYAYGAPPELFELTLDGFPKWSLLPAVGSGPPVGYGFHAFHDRGRNQVFVMERYSTRPAEVWRLDLTGTPTWTALGVVTPSGFPGARHHATLDERRRRIVLWGGGTAVWTLELSGAPGAEWTPLTTTGPHPPGRGDAQVVHDFANDRMIVQGGWSEGEYGEHYHSDVWALELSPVARWELLEPSGTSPRSAWGAAVYIPDRRQMLLFGGVDSEYRFANADVWALSLGSRAERGRGPRLERLSPAGFEGATTFALHGAAAPPRSGALEIAFSLPDAAAARLELFSVTGSRIESRDVGALGAGRHVVRVGARLAPGVYFARLSRAGSARSTRVVVL